MSRPIRIELPIAIALTGLACATAANAQQHRRLRQVFVATALRELRQERAIAQADRARVDREVRAAIVGALQAHVPHLGFTDQNTTECCQLECVLGPEGPFPTTSADVAGAAVCWHLRLGLPDHGAVFETTLTFRTGDEFWDRRPDADGFVAEVRRFFGTEGTAAGGAAGGAPTTADAAAAGARIDALMTTMFAKIPLELSHEMQHVGNSKLIVARTPRHEFGCSIPDGSLFALVVRVPDPPFPPQPRDFLARLLSVADLAATPLDPTQRACFVVDVEQAFGEATTLAHVTKLTETGPPGGTVDPTVYLRRLGPVARACLESHPDDLDLQD